MITDFEILSYDVVPNRLIYSQSLSESPIEPYPTNQPLRFTNGLNVMAGLNGSGKSFILNTIGNMTFCSQGSIPKVTHKLVGNFTEAMSPFLRNRKEKKSIPQFPTVKLLKDGGLCFYQNPDQMAGLSYAGAHFDDDFLGEFKQSSRIRKNSSGKQRLGFFKQFLQRVMGYTIPKDIEKAARGHNGYTSLSKKQQDAILSWFGDGTGIPTLLLDEPDRNLDFVATMELWKLIHELSKKFQVIATSHHPFAFISNPENPTNYIAIGDPTYLDTCLECASAYTPSSFLNNPVDLDTFLA